MSMLTTETDIQIATDAAFSTLLVNESVDHCTARTFIADELPYGTDLYSRVRHRHPETGTGNWSNPVSFRIIVPEEIIGVCLDNSVTKGVFYWIDGLGNKISSFDWKKCSIYTNILMATVDDRAPVTMTRIPLFYVKTAASGPVGSFAAGKKCWWISTVASPDFRPASCFKRSTSKDNNGKYVISPFCYIGTFLGHTETVGGVTCLGSKRSQTMAASISDATFRTYINNRNNEAAGISGFRMFDIWDLSAIRMLLLIATANSDVQSVWGANSDSIQNPKTGSTNARAVFKGTHADPQISLEDLWQCYWYTADLCKIVSGVVTLKSPMDRVSAISFGAAAASRYTMPYTSGWMRDVLDCPMVIGDDTHDLMELFIAKSVVASESQATFSDYSSYLWGNNGYTYIQTLCTGGSSWYASVPTISGIFYNDRSAVQTGATDANAYFAQKGCRICKS